VAYRGDLAVHHPTRRDDVRAGGRLRDSGARVELEGRVVVDLTAFEHESTVTVIGVLAEAAVRDDHAGVAEAPAQRANRLLDHAGVREGSRPLGILDGR